jgi:hypothetical protein
VDNTLQLLNLDPAIDAAEQALTRDCLAHRGLDMPVVPVFVRPEIGITGMAPFTELEARQFGFALRVPHPRVEPLKQSGTNNQERARSHDALFGSGLHRVSGPLGSVASADGCLAEARRELFGSVRNYLDVTWFVNEVRHHQFGWTRDQRARLAARRYLACIAMRGYALSSFGEAYRIAARRFSGVGARPEQQRAMALAEASCQRKSRVWPIWDSMALERLAPWLQRQAHRIEALLDLADEAAARAHTILGADWRPASPA